MKNASIAGYWFPREDLDPDSITFDMQFKGAKEKNCASKIGAVRGSIFAIATDTK
jgi:hypothetical protein